MKTSALTIGAAAMLSQGLALATEENNESSLTIITGVRGVVRVFPPTDFLPFSDPYNHFDVAIKIESPIADSFTCHFPYNHIAYSTTARFFAPGSNDFFPNSTLTENRYFAAWTDSIGLVRSAETASSTSVANQVLNTQKISWMTIPAEISGVEFYVGIETERTACGANVVALKARALLKRKSDGQITELKWSPERETHWNPCIPA
jgi:hypothetical protein